MAITVVPFQLRKENNNPLETRSRKIQIKLPICLLVSSKGKLCFDKALFQFCK